MKPRGLKGTSFITNAVYGRCGFILGILLLAAPPTSAIRIAAVYVGSLHLQESGVVAPMGKLIVPSRSMSSHCTTMVSPTYPANAARTGRVSRVIVRVVIWKSGNVSPVRVLSGEGALEAEAMNTVRLWRYKPFLRDGVPMDITTDVAVDFDPTQQGGFVTHPNR